MFLEGQIIEFLDDDQLKPGYVRKQERDRLQVIDPRGRHLSVHGDRVVVSHGAVSESEYPSAVKRILERVQEREAEIDVELLWQSVGSSTRDYQPLELSEVFFSESTPEAASAMFHALSRDALFFKRSGLRFLPKTAEQVAAEQTRRVRQREREESREKLTSAVQRLVRGEPPGEDLQPAVDRIQSWMRHKNGDEVGELLEQVAAPLTAREAAYEVLLRAGRVDPSADRFLTVAGIEPALPPAVVQAADAVNSMDLEAEIAGRRREDWRSLAAFSIDDEDTVEIDDALTVREEGGEFVVGIHIADASAYVAKGDPLDAEARRRVSTVYLPTVAARMLPDRVSTGLASLNHGEDRPALTLEARFDRSFNLLRHRFVHTAIRIQQRLTYESADTLIQNEDSSLCALQRIARVILQGRADKGAIVSRRPEVKVRVLLDAMTERIVVTKLDPSSPSRFLVSEFMVLFNGVAGDFSAVRGIPVLFRTQEPRDPLPPDAAGLPEALAFDKLKRTFKRSRLSTAPGLHSGLGLSAYTQASSPIRRYADLVAQRQLGAAIRGESLPHTRDELQQIAAAAEAAEVETRQLEERANTYWLLRYLAREKAGVPLSAVVLDRKGFVELEDLYLRGRLPDPGAITPGSTISVTIDRVDPLKGEIRFKRL
jgi:exoribonuclease-2